MEDLSFAVMAMMNLRERRLITNLYPEGLNFSDMKAVRAESFTTIENGFKNNYSKTYIVNERAKSLLQK